MNLPLTHNTAQKFYLEKWFLDMVTDKGEAMIFYAARLCWRSITVPYKSMLWYSPEKGAGQKTKFYNAHFPSIKDNLIYWQDAAFKVTGVWQANASSVNACLFQSEEGGLQWNCFQPSSIVMLNSKSNPLKGMGYAEKLVLTVEPWKIPMQQLRWGRYVSVTDHLVWIELKDNTTKQWIWHNGERITTAIINDNEIILPSSKIHLKLIDKTIIESENKISKVAKQLAKFVPGFCKSMPLHFLMAAGHKWRSKGVLSKGNIISGEGWVIHELVDFSNKTPGNEKD